ncbi:hypothetical protein B5M09_009546 [Aphanomyces astaci]|uniref:DNA mismatch repair protein MutS-like N-terminal domain-containing protein n=1 Tax=Aphanomyces astaci TaxID=112090 RepID=A0A3R7WGQ5_APHAT|nr:hypothetical protein B5M09_009546 [Aphanomyces astaci]
MLLFQVGDFYELFSDDARRASNLLNITLTRKTKAKAGMSRERDALDIMCGFPLSSLNTYVEKLVRQHGEKVAICNQVESALAAKQRGGVGMDSLVQRQVVRVITPGSLTEDSMLLPTQNNYLASISKEPDQATCHIAYTDISTGEFVVLTVHMDDVDSELTRLQPSELLVPAQDDVANVQDSTWWRQRLENAMNALGTVVTFRKQGSVEFANSDASVAAASMIHEYLAYTHVGTPSSHSHACKPSSAVRQLVGRMRFDVSVWRSLELTKVTTLGYNDIGL